ncbi:hypothetical protein [Vibrio phage 27Ua.3]|nr:hypothetical protein [Vibrio phage 27Ua.3]
MEGVASWTGNPATGQPGRRPRCGAYYHKLRINYQTLFNSF